MGKIKQGILGGFNGKTGSVVGASWKGIAYMRGQAQSIKNPRTESQQANRTLFGQVSDIMSKALEAVRNGFLGVDIKKSAFNCAVQSSLDAINSADGEFSLERLKYSGGSLQPFIGGTVSFSDNSISVVANFATAPPFEGEGCLVAVFEGSYPGAPVVQVLTQSFSGPSLSVNFTVPVPSGLDYSKCYLSAFTYSTELKRSSETIFVDSYTPA